MMGTGAGTLRRTLRIALVAAVAIAGQGAGAAGIDPVPAEYEIKAAFVYGVMKFVTWQPGLSGGDAVTVAVLGPAAAADIARVFAAKQLRGQPIVVRGYSRARELQPAQVLFIATESAAERRDALKAVDGLAVLTIVEGDGAPAAVISLSVVATRLVFDVDLTAAKTQGVQLSSNLLVLARSVQGSREWREGS